MHLPTKLSFALLAAAASHVACTLQGHKFSLMPLGDSITWGFASSDGNGYRKDLYTALQGAGATVDFVGTVKSGNMADNDNEGYPGYTIDQIDSATRNAINAGLKPDVILLHAGTNDLNGNVDVSNAGTRLKKLISDVNAAWPQATVLVAQIIGSTNAGLHTKINSYNAQIPGIVQGFASQGKKVAVVDQSGISQSSVMSDSLHPNDSGYAKMAQTWLATLQDNSEKGWY